MKNPRRNPNDPKVVLDTQALFRDAVARKPGITEHGMFCPPKRYE
jgi:hypothetical protein